MRRHIVYSIATAEGLGKIDNLHICQAIRKIRPIGEKSLPSSILDGRVPQLVTRIWQQRMCIWTVNKMVYCYRVI